MRSPAEQMSQRRLVEELRISIDAARATARPSQGILDRINELARENPQGIVSRHVQHNIGRARREWLADFLRAHG